MNLVRLIKLFLICFFALSVNSVAQETQQEDFDKKAVQPQESNRTERPFIGIQMFPTEDNSGVRINRVIARTSADRAGILVNDVIIKMDDTDVPDRETLVEAIQQHEVGDIVVFTIRREEKEVKVKLVLSSEARPFVVPRKNELQTEMPEDRWQQALFPSEDGLEIMAELYLKSDDKQSPFIVLCHQAGWSRGEYREIAPKLVELGFNCLAIDQRSGGTVNDVTNETARKAAEAKKEATYVDAEQDMIAAIKWARANHAEGKVLLWGSSYSAALALRVAGEHPELVDGVLAFAPGEYFIRFKKPADWIASSAKKIKSPTLITSAKHEFPRWEAIFNAIPGDTKVKFVPETKGNHGSRALWAKFDDSPEYWNSVKAFLSQFN